MDMSGIAFFAFVDPHQPIKIVGDVNSLEQLRDHLTKLIEDPESKEVDSFYIDTNGEIFPIEISIGYEEMKYTWDYDTKY